MKKAKVRINGALLSTGQVMTLRVALNAYYCDMGKLDILGNDEHGLLMVKAYREQSANLLCMLTDQSNFQKGE